MILNAYTGTATHHLLDGRVRQFKPEGELHHVREGTVRRKNPVSRLSGPGEQLAARLFVGLNVGQDVVWTIDDVIRITFDVRKQQKASTDSSELMMDLITKARSEERAAIVKWLRLGARRIDELDDAATYIELGAHWKP